MTNWQIVTACPAHIDLASQVIALIAPEARAKKMLDWQSAEIVGQISNGDALLGLVANSVFAYIGLTAWQRYVEISALVVSPNFRQQGFGTLLVNSGILLARRKYPRKGIIILGNEESARIGTKSGFVSKEKSFFDQELWQPCQSCPEQSQHPHCHCQAMILGSTSKS